MSISELDQGKADIEEEWEDLGEEDRLELSEFDYNAEEFGKKLPEAVLGYEPDTGIYARKR